MIQITNGDVKYDLIFMDINQNSNFILNIVNYESIYKMIKISTLNSKAPIVLVSNGKSELECTYNLIRPITRDNVLCALASRNTL